MQKHPALSFLEHFKDLHDLRVDRTREHELIDMLIVKETAMRNDGGNKNGACLGLSSGRLHIKPSAPGIPKPTRDKLRLAPASLGWRSTHRDVGQGDARSHPSIKMSKNSRRLNWRSESKAFQNHCDLVRFGAMRPQWEGLLAD
jgi:hypothetical protein